MTPPSPTTAAADASPATTLPTWRAPSLTRVALAETAFNSGSINDAGNSGNLAGIT